MPAPVSSPVSDREARLSRIRSFSRVLAGCCVPLAVLLTAGLLFFWLAAQARSIAADAQIPSEWLANFGIGQRVVGFLISFLPLACLILALTAARRCFNAFAEGDFFNREAAGNLKGFATGLLA